MSLEEIVMNCDEIRPLLSAYYDGEASPEERDQVERHLARCEDCRRILAEYRALGGDIRALAVPIPPAGLRRDVWQRIEAQRAGQLAVTGNQRVQKEKAPAAKGNVVALPTARKQPAMAAVFAGLGESWSRALPAALLAVGLLALLIFFMLRNNPVTQAAQITNPLPLSDYTQAITVQFNKQVDESAVISQTTVLEVTGATTGTVSVEKTYKPNTPNTGGTLAIKPAQLWAAGANYIVNINAPQIPTNIGGQPLGAEPIRLSFSALPYTPTPTNTPTSTPVPIDTPQRPTIEPTALAQQTVVSTPPGTVVAIGNTPQPTATQTANPTNTPAQPSPTYTTEPSNTPVASPTPLLTHTPVPSSTPTERPTGTPTPTPSATVGLTRRNTPTPGGTPTVRLSPTPAPPCNIMPANGFGKVWSENPQVRQRVGCPTVSEIAIPQAAQQEFQGGYMFWRGDTRTIYVFISGGPNATVGTWKQYQDTWQEGEPMPSPTVQPPGGLYAPVRGFGKLWYSDETLRIALGWATEAESAATGAFQTYRGGEALWTSDRLIYFMYSDGIWERFEDTYVPVTPAPNSGRTQPAMPTITP